MLQRNLRLLKLKEELSTEVEIVVADVTKITQVRELAKRAGEVDILINNAGFGVFGAFSETALDDELKMLDTNVRALHMLTKLFLSEFKKKNKALSDKSLPVSVKSSVSCCSSFQTSPLGPLP